MKTAELDISGGLEAFWEKVIREDQGPLENMFRLLPYISVPFLGGLGSVLMAAALMLVKYTLGISLQQLGKDADTFFGLKPGDDPRNVVDENKLEQFLLQQASKKTASEDRISKRAGLGSTVFKLIKIIAKSIPKLLLAAGSAFVFTTAERGFETGIGKYVEKTKSNTVKDFAEELAQKYK